MTSGPRPTAAVRAVIALQPPRSAADEGDAEAAVPPVLFNPLLPLPPVPPKLATAPPPPVPPPLVGGVPGVIGAAKPMPAAYQAIADALGVAPGECLFVDDHAEHVAGAARLGMRAVRWRALCGLPGGAALRGLDELDRHLDVLQR